jgi:uncharacterized damage-inducible protein DinB
MSLAQLTLGDVARELQTTRRVIERVPDGQFDWRPHAKSMTLGRLATHIAELPGLALVVLSSDEFDMATRAVQPRTASDTAAVLALFDENAGKMQAVLADADDATLERAWTMRHGAHVIMTQPKHVAVRTLGVSHQVHHRGQLTVYLRLLDVPLPSVYGPTADER